jgi:hypothetical protein
MNFRKQIYVPQNHILQTFITLVFLSCCIASVAYLLVEFYEMHQQVESLKHSNQKLQDDLRNLAEIIKETHLEKINVQQGRSVYSLNLRYDQIILLVLGISLFGYFFFKANALHALLAGLNESFLNPLKYCAKFFEPTVVSETIKLADTNGSIFYFEKVINTNFFKVSIEYDNGQRLVMLDFFEYLNAIRDANPNLAELSKMAPSVDTALAIANAPEPVKFTAAAVASMFS